MEKTILELLQRVGGEMPLMDLVDALRVKGVDQRLKKINELKENGVLCIIPGSERGVQQRTTVALIL